MARLKRDQIHYLCLEGGGGKGLAYSGAIKALEDLQIIPVLRGFAGSSAGAMTALFLSCGYTSKEINWIMKNTDFNAFYEVEPGIIPRLDVPDGCGRRPEWFDGVTYTTLIDLSEMILTAPFGTGLDALSFLTYVKDLPKPAKDLVERIKKARKLDQDSSRSLFILAVLVGTFLPRVLTSLAPELVQKLTYEINESLALDLGIFTGCAVRNFLNKWVTIARYRLQNGEPLEAGERLARLEELSEAYDGHGHPRSMQPPSRTEKSLRDALHSLKNERYTFGQHKSDFGVKLAVTASNIETFKSHIFSETTTPRFPVVDAVRMSMSIPFVFKPVIIRDTKLISQLVAEGEQVDVPNPDLLRGVWADGGLFNNTPIGIFDSDVFEKGSGLTCQDLPYTLGIRLGAEELERKDVFTFYEFLSSYLGLFMGTGETRISATYRNIDQCIMIEPVGLSLLNFTPDAKKLERAVKIAEESVLEYFS